MFKSGYAIDVRCWRSSWKLGENVLLFIPTYIWHCSESLERELESISARLWAGGLGNITGSLHSLAHVCAELADSGLSVVMWYFIFIRVWRRIVLNHIEMITFLFSKRLKQSRISNWGVSACMSVWLASLKQSCWTFELLGVLPSTPVTIP